MNFTVEAAFLSYITEQVSDILCSVDGRLKATKSSLLKVYLFWHFQYCFKKLYNSASSCILISIENDISAFTKIKSKKNLKRENFKFIYDNIDKMVCNSKIFNTEFIKPGKEPKFSLKHLTEEQ